MNCTRPTGTTTVNSADYPDRDYALHKTPTGATTVNSVDCPDRDSSCTVRDYLSADLPTLSPFSTRSSPVLTVRHQLHHLCGHTLLRSKIQKLALFCILPCIQNPILVGFLACASIVVPVGIIFPSFFAPTGGHLGHSRSIQIYPWLKPTRAPISTPSPPRMHNLLKREVKNVSAQTKVGEVAMQKS